MKWVNPTFSKKRVRRAGDCLVSEDATAELQADAMEVLSNWRSAHAYPMHSMLMLLRQKSSEIDPSAVVVQRLKRTPSIIGKLHRFESMKLDRMQDIGGCRSVVKDVSTTEKLCALLQKSRTRHDLHRIQNYINTPKPSGYRGIHMIYKYRGAKQQFRDYFVEIQLRSKVQHAWATTVEIVDTFTAQALKASDGDQQWLDFFRFASAEFARIENRPMEEALNGVDTLGCLEALEAELNARTRLDFFAITTRHVEKQTTSMADYFLLEIDSDQPLLKITQYPAALLSAATDEYLRKEKESAGDFSKNVALVSADSVRSLKAAYPNYFADSRAFLRYLSRVLPSAVAS